MNLTEPWTTADGTPLLLRPVRPHDAPALIVLFEGLSDSDRRRRFHGAVKGLSPAALQRMTCINALSDLAFVVTTSAADGELVIADARCVIDATGQSAEFALVVSRAWRGRGVGERCMHALQRAAAQRGLRWLYGSVLADNLPMLSLMRRCGFHCTASRHDDRLVLVERLVGSPVRPRARHALRRLAFHF